MLEISGLEISGLIGPHKPLKANSHVNWPRNLTLSRVLKSYQQKQKSIVFSVSNYWTHIYYGTCWAFLATFLAKFLFNSAFENDSSQRKINKKIMVRIRPLFPFFTKTDN